MEEEFSGLGVIITSTHCTAYTGLILEEKFALRYISIMSEISIHLHISDIDPHVKNADFSSNKYYHITNL